MKLYHGSKNKFEKFSYDFVGSNAGNDEGYGFYFTDSKELAERYADGGYVYTVNFKKEKSLNEKKISITITELRKVLQILHKSNDILNDFNDVEYYGYSRVMNEAVEMLRENKNDVDMVAELCNICGDKETVLKTIAKVTGRNCINSTDNKFIKNGDNSRLIIALVNDDIEIVNIEKSNSAN